MSKYFVHLYNKNKTCWSSDLHEMVKLKHPYLQGGIGSDAYFRLDGRWSLETMIGVAEEIMEKRKVFRKSIEGFKILNCDGIGHNERVVYTHPSEMRYGV